MIISLEPHYQNWKTEFEALKFVFETELEGFDLDIQHIGSTAIPGLLAKPILDIDVILKEKHDYPGVSACLQSLGYSSKGDQGIPGRFAFRQISPFAPRTVDGRKWKEHHLYVCYADSLAYKNHILFRDMLLSNKALVKEYAQLKKN